MDILITEPLVGVAEVPLTPSIEHTTVAAAGRRRPMDVAEDSEKDIPSTGQADVAVVAKNI